VKDLDIVEEQGEKCENCHLNNCKHSSHPLRTAVRTEKPGAVLHIDTAGPSNIPSLSNSRYLVLCKDEATNCRQIAFLENKSQITNEVKQFITRTKLETNNDVLKLMTDNGSEFINRDLQNFLNGKGILSEHSAPYVAA